MFGNGEPFIITSSFDTYVDFTLPPYFTIYANGDDPARVMAIGLDNYDREDGYIELPDSSATYSIYDSQSERCDYEISHFESGWLNIIDYDSFEDYVSGTFEFTSVNSDCDTLRVTDGRFDLRVRR